MRIQIACKPTNQNTSIFYVNVLVSFTISKEKTNKFVHQFDVTQYSILFHLFSVSVHVLLEYCDILWKQFDNGYLNGYYIYIVNYLT
jgi:hypothetical protein